MKWYHFVPTYNNITVSLSLKTIRLDSTQAVRAGVMGHDPFDLRPKT